MSNDALSTATLAALKELRAKRAAIDRAIVAMEALLGISDSADVPPPSKPKLPRELAGLGPADACMWMLREKGTPMTNREIYDSLASVGYKKTKSTDHVGAALHHRAKKTQDVRRDGNHWVDVAKPENAETPLNGAA